MVGSNVGRWTRWHDGHPARPYGDPGSYQAGADWLAGCELVEDWGCGPGFLSTLIPEERYRGIDGSPSPVVSEIADLARYRSRVPGVFIRHVLEHDPRWADILDNALASFTQRMALILFTPLVHGPTRDLEWEDPPGVPNLAFNPDDLTVRMAAAGAVWRLEHQVSCRVKFGGESVFLLERA